MSKPTTKEKLITLAQEMSELTKGECAQCRAPHSCCATEHCEEARRYAKESWNVELTETGHPKLPFMGINPVGCTVPPHLRPICTVHTCDIQSLGFKKGDIPWTKRYFSLREKLDVLLWKQDQENQKSPQT